ncbi:hypothetical protein DH2020_019934 [Rehmannia glutinosa]|uniref:Bifunctional inhibitor/plant lipid transfer protein/seed storage helical domain-containing protein n=1 Tax=Rehmannia glutinosa TaxID=99300 RepID=A0ABR0WIW4_REHGL
MENFTHFLVVLSALVMMIIVVGPAVADGQSSSNTVCTGAMMRGFTSCIGFLASGSNVSRPSSACCSSLRDLMSNGQDCLCLIVTGGVPFEVPINRNLAISLPRACRMSGVPIECKDPETPSPPSQGGPSIYPGLSPPSPRAPFVPQPFTPPSSTTPGGGMTPPLVPGGDEFRHRRRRMRPTLTPSAAQSCQSSLPSLIVASMGVILLNFAKRKKLENMDDRMRA